MSDVLTDPEPTVEPARTATDPEPTLEPALTAQDLCRLLQLKMTAFYKYRSLGRFDRFELHPRIGPRRYSRKLVQAWLDGEAGSSRFTLTKRSA